MPYYENKSIPYLKKIKTKIKDLIYTKITDFNIEYYITKEPVSFEQRYSGEKKIGEINKSWGELWDCAWFNFKATVPASACGKSICALIDISGELYIADENGEPIRGLTTRMSTFDLSLGKPEKIEFPLYASSKGNEVIDLWADCANNDLFGAYIENGIIKQADISYVNEQIKLLYYDWEVLLELVEYLPVDSSRRNRVLFTLNQVAGKLRNFEEDEVRLAREILGIELRKSNGDYDLNISAIGHAHMDLAWLWPIRETKRKIGRTFATVIKNLEKYPSYVFGAGQAQQYKWLKTMYPKLYEKVKQYVKEGRIELQGGAWVESDGNLPSGEAFVRQFLYGQQFFEEEFGKTCKAAFLPDTFGFSANLPQIFKKSGIDYFVTSRAFINSNYKYHHSYWWKGQDGSRILTHAIPEGTYNSSAAPRALIKTEQSYTDKGVSSNALILFGIGDGGGGPGEEHLERLNREENLQGLPPVKQEFVESFFKKLETQSDKFKTWDGELFFNAFQGTFSSQSKNKYYNRKMELALRELEYISALTISEQKKYPKEQIDELWQETLLFQFHDILPGSSIDRVNIEAVERYETILNKTKKLIKEACESIVVKNTNKTVINTLSYKRNEWIKTDGEWAYIDIEPLGIQTIETTSDFSIIINEIMIDENSLENDCIKIQFNKDGSISSIFDKVEQKEILRSSGNIFDVYDDYGDGWLIQENYRNKSPEQFILDSWKFDVDGPSASRINNYSYMNSTIKQKIIITHGSMRVDFETNIYMADQGKMVRTSFPITVQAKEAVCDIQFGNIARPVHENTLIDTDRYEVYSHKWIDYSDGGYGVALLNDGKYGHSIRDNILDLDLVRTTTYPGKNGDMGTHTFKYAIYPHSGNYQNSVVSEAYKFNIPPTIFNGSIVKNVDKFVNIDKPNIILETVKQSEDGTGIIIRLYEGYGQQTNSTLSFMYKNVELVNMLEKPIELLSQNNQVNINFKPFEVHTFKISV